MRRYISLTALIMCVVMTLCSMGVAANAVEFTGADRVVIVLDPGHGCAGTFADGHRSEGAYNILTAQYIRDALAANSSFEVYLTNEKVGVTPSHYERAAFADSVNADVMISVHYNSSLDTADSGMEVYSSVIEKFAMDELAAKCVAYGSDAVEGVINRGVKHRVDSAGFYWNEYYQWDIEGDSTSGVLSDYYGIITWGLKFGVPTIILEELYLSNEGDKALATEENIKAIAQAQASAIIDYYTNHEHTYGGVQRDIPRSCITVGKQSEHCTVCGHRRNVTAIAETLDTDAHFYRPVDVNKPEGEWTCVYTHSLINKAKLQHEHHTGDSLKGVELPVGVVLPTTPVQPVIPPETDTGDKPVEEGEHVHKFRVKDGFERQFAVIECEGCGLTQRKEPLSAYNCKAEGHLLMPYSMFEGFEHLTAQDTVKSCVVDGKKFSFCLACGEELYDVDPAPGHKLIQIGAKEPTCVEAGVTELQCEVCAERVYEETAAAGHKFEEEEIRATCLSDGKKVRRCTVCGAEDVVIIPAPENGHAYSGVVKSEATSDKDGLIEYTCTHCGDNYTESIPATGGGMSITQFFNEVVGLPLPIIAFIIVIILLVAAAIIVPVVIRRRRAAAEEIVPDVMDFMPANVDLNEIKSEEDEEVVAKVIPEIAQQVVTEEDSFSLGDVEITVEEAEAPDDSAREIALEALKQNLGKNEEPKAEEEEAEASTEENEE